MPNAQPAVALTTSNGTGMGHLSRQISVALALRDVADPTIFSLSRAVGVVEHYGLPGEYCPSRERGWMSDVAWQDYLADRLRAFVAETGARALVFDGVVPYIGLLRARLTLRDVSFVWMRRGFWRPGTRQAPLRSARLFDRVLEPGDLAIEGDRGPTAELTDAVRLPPLSLTEHVAPLPRREAAAALGLDPDRPTALVTLSSGALNDIATPGGAVLDTLLRDPSWQVAVTRSAITRGGVPLDGRQRCVELRDVYPLVRYLNAFDAAIAAGGYNSVHELLYAGLPTLFVPNSSSGIDDQVARTRHLARQGLALFADESNLEQVRSQAALLHDEVVRKDLRDACAALDPPTGSVAAAAEVLDVGAPAQRHGWHGTEIRAKTAAMRALGPRGTKLARRVLRRSPGPSPTGPLTVRMADELPAAADDTSALVFTEQLDPAQLGARHPVEHLLPGAGSRYRDERLRIARRYYSLRE